VIEHTLAAHVTDATPPAHVVLQLFPQLPQDATVFVVFVSQPFGTRPSQLPNPALHPAIVHALATQPAMPLVTEHAMPHAPQLPGDVVMLTSQPSATVPLQFAKPGLQAATVQPPAEQPAVPFATTHALPQAPQLEGDVLVFTSQPSLASPLQLPKPGLQPATVHAPPAHPATPLGIEQTPPQIPQLVGEVLVFVSHPSAARPLQFPKPGLQPATVHVLATQPAVPFATEHTEPQPPQLVGDVAVFTSQPSPTSPLQFEKPALHEATVQAPAEQPAVPLATEQTLPHAPQFDGVVFVFTSQPSATVPLQFRKPELHEATVHDPPAHPAVPFATEHTVPHAPQFDVDVLVFASHPSATSPLQFPKPALHPATVHAPPAHPGVPFAATQTFPQALQLVGDVFTLTSQPSLERPLQFAKPALQDATVHVPPAQPAVPPATEQTIPHAPQLLGVVFVFTSHPSAAAPLQFPKPAKHDPMLHIPPAQAPTAFA